MVQIKKKIAILHRCPRENIRETNASFPYLLEKGVDVLTFKKFNRTGKIKKFWKGIAWIFYAPFLVLFKGYDVIYCDDSFPIYPILVKMVSPKSKIVLRLGDLHLMYYYKGIAYKILHAIEKIAWKIADKIIVISGPMKEYVCKELGMQETDYMYGYHPKVLVVLDPVDPKDFPLNGTQPENTIMFHGLLVENKKVDLLIEAARRLPEHKFVVIGDGPDKKRLMEIAPKNVFFKGWVPFSSIHKWIETCSVGVALRSENTGNDYVVTSAFLQYGVMGKPCLVTRRKVFGDYEWQFSSVEEMVEKIKYLIDAPEEGEKLREYILEKHDAEQIAGEIWQHLMSV